MIREYDKYFIYDKCKTINFKYFIKLILNYIDNIYYQIVFKKIKLPIYKNKKYNVVLCAIFKDEADYLIEWIEFHKIIGIDHFYLYNNNSSDNYFDILNTYIKNGDVTLIDWPKQQGQMEAYQNCMKTYGQESKWVGFIDIDEFIIPKNTVSLYSFLEGFERKPVVLIYWKYFGSSGLINRDMEGLVIEDFTSCWPKYTDIGKCFFNTRYTYAPELKENAYMHYMWAKHKKIEVPPVNVFNKVCTYGINRIPNDNMPVQINHYVIKSYNEFMQKKAKKGDAIFNINTHDEEYFIKHESKCCDVDLSAYKYLDELKKHTR